MKTRTTGRLLLRQWHEDDLDAWAELNADPAVTEFLPPMTREQSAQSIERFAASAAEHGYGLVAVEAVEAAGVLVGMCGVIDVRFDAHFTPAMEIGWRLAREHWGKGYATEAASDWLRFAFTELDRDEVVSFTVDGNTNSCRVMERIGMSRDPSGDFAHPALAPDDPLSPHVLYRLSANQWLNRQAE